MKPNARVLLCVGAKQVAQLADLGLGRRNWSESWVTRVGTSAEARRRVLDQSLLSEIWVFGSDDMDALNLAAGLIRKRSGLRVFLLSPDGTGSLLSRCSAAGVVPCVGRQATSRLFDAAQARYGLATSANDASASRGVVGPDASERGIPHRSGSEIAFARLGGPPPFLSSYEVRGQRGSLPANAFEGGEDISNASFASGFHDQAVSNASLESSSSGVRDRGNPILPSPVPASNIEPSGVRGQKTMPFSVICGGDDASVPVGRASALPDSNDERRGFVCSVVSGSGGSGKSTVSTLMGIVSQYSGVRTAIIDADFQFGDQQWLLGSESALDAATLLRHPERVSELVAEGGIPAIICPPKKLEDSELLYSSFGQIVSMVRSSFDVVIVNTGSFWIDALLDLFELSNQVLFLVDQRPSSVRACAHALDLCIRCGLPTQQFRFALNRCGKQALLTSLDVSCALKGVDVRELREGGFVVSELLGAGLPLELVSSKNAFVEDVVALAGDLLPLPDGPMLPEGTGGSHRNRKRKRVQRLGRRQAA